MNRTEITPQEIFQRLLLVIPSLPTIQGAAKSEVRTFMDLHLDVLRRTGNACHIALAHYYRQHGDSIPDPDMEILVDFSEQTAIATSFQDSFCYREAAPRDISPEAVRIRRDLNTFLAQWLSNLREQGHVISSSGMPA